MAEDRTPMHCVDCLSRNACHMTADLKGLRCLCDCHQTKVFNPRAYAEGIAAGKADRRIGQRSEYAWSGAVLDPLYSYAWHFSRGYRDAWRI